MDTLHYAQSLFPVGSNPFGPETLASVASDRMMFVLSVFALYALIAHALCSETSWLSVRLYKARLRHYCKSANEHRRIYQSAQKELNRILSESQNPNEFIVADLSLKIYSSAIKNLKHEVRCGLLHIQKPHRREDELIANIFLYEVIDESLDAVDIIINYESTNPDDIMQSKFYEFWKSALDVVRNEGRGACTKID